MTKAELLELIDGLDDSAVILSGSDEELNDVSEGVATLEFACLDRDGWHILHPDDVKEHKRQGDVVQLVILIAP